MLEINQKSNNTWQAKVDKFVYINQKELAAFAWGLYLDKGKSTEILGMDLEPNPHFFACPKENLELFNRSVHGQIQEILGILDGYNPELEILLLAIFQGELKLINFVTDPPPPICFAELNPDLGQLLDGLEAKLGQNFS